MWSGVLLCLVGCVSAITRDQFYPYGEAYDHVLPRGADVSSPEIYLNVPIVFFGETYETAFVNNYGLISFRADFPSFLNAEFPLPYASIAAYYSNINTATTGSVYYRESNDTHVLSKATDSIQNAFSDFYEFKPQSVFIATWIEVTYAGGEDKKNSFQIAVISNGTESFVELLYPEREIQWIQKETEPGSLPDAKAQAGFIAEDGRVFTLRGSGSHQIRNIVSWSNVHEPGKYVFRVGNIQPHETIDVPDQYNENEIEIEEESDTCANSGPSVCHIQARCLDYSAGICCQCNEGYYGNGKSCINYNVPLRVHGKLKGVLNNVNLNDVDLQAYVVVAEGRSYTALSQVPPAIGSSLQLLNVFGGVVGWLFAKPSGAGKNGYQLTGAQFNHSADIYFPESNDRVTIEQEYLGHDVFDQITLEADIRGSVPNVPKGSRLEVTEYEEQLTIIEAGVIQSVSTRTFINKITGQNYLQRVSQTFTFNTCRFAPFSDEDKVPLILKSGKNYLGFEITSNIVRYGSSNTIVPFGQEDPCIKGRSTCAPHSTCVAQNDSFTCVCQSGYTSVYTYDDTVNCIDVDECAAGTHNCDINADCFNLDGSFQCRCRERFEGNGVTCNLISRCKSKICDPNAQCIENPAEDPFCLCNPGYTGDGERCWRAYCTNCSPFAHCTFSEASYSYNCQCNPGYVGNGEYCSQDVSTPSEDVDTTVVANLPVETTTPVTTEVEYNETFVLPNCNVNGCSCPSGYSSYKDELDNDLCRIDSYNDPVLPPDNDTLIRCEQNTDCPPNAVCLFSNEQTQATYDQEKGQCQCQEGYVGDAYECIEKTGVSCSCGIGAHCIETAAGDLLCVCDSGYHGDGFVCRPNSSCLNNSDCESNAECRPDPNTNELVCQCIEGYIKDQSDACIPDKQLCNGAVCADHASCLYDDTLRVSYCHCDDGYEGEAIWQCVPRGRTCDIYNDCSPDALCTKVEESYQCICREGYVGDGYNCNLEMNCRTNPYLCDIHASCLKTSDGYECECNSGYNGNGSFCELNPRKGGDFLVASDGASVYRVPFKVTPRDFATPFNSAINQIAVGIDVDCLTGHIYWGDVVSNVIKRASYDGSGYEQFLSSDVQSPEGIAVDWVARNIFWTDSKKLTIEVANLDTKTRKVLFAKDGIYNPRGIAVHPGRGKIFWSDWNRSGPKIEWANMDGSQRGVFLDQVDVKLPNSLAIDWVRDRLCYADAGLFSIRCVSIDSLERDIVAANCSYPFGLAINGDMFYWTDWKTLKIESIDTLTQVKGQVPIATASRRLYGVSVAPNECPALSNFCQYRNGNCDPNQICLPNGQGGRTCVDTE